MTPLESMALLSFVFLGLLAWIFSRLAFARREQIDLEAWWSSYSPDRYRPMRRMMSRRDFDYLRSEPGFRPEMLKRLRRQRAAAFAAYLRAMRADFARLQMVGWALVMAGGVSPAIRDELFRQKVLFTRNYCQVQLGLLAYRLGIGSVDASGLVEAMRAASASFQPLMAPSAA
ncbi:MAG: hypothetical protein HY858_03010 [Candidatus Solibacter usitatus]|nr:hypothetical protein [Candidatus Solibacter usitatus]